MTAQISTLVPGFLVSLKTAIVGRNCKYFRTELEGQHITAEGSQKARWETELLISDPVEYEAGKRARSKARSLITSVCTNSDFGLLCPEKKGAELERAIAAAREVANEFNGAADQTSVIVYVIRGRIAPNDAEAVAAISSELRDLIAQMEEGVRNVDIKAVREAANKARAISAMLSPEAAGRVQEAVALARKVARAYTKAGDAAAQEVDQLAVAALARARTSFLDIIDDAGTVGTVDAEARAVDFDPVESDEPPSAPGMTVAASFAPIEVD